MDPHDLATTRRTLHGIAELVMAGPQYAASGDIRLRVTPEGFATVASPDLRLSADVLVGTTRAPLEGTFATLAAAVGVEARDLRDVYAHGPEVTGDDPVVLDPGATRVLLDAFARGDGALRLLAPDEEPVLWPEHLDVGVAVGEVNFGVSPGDAAIGEPYAYVGPWTPREGAFWNTSFGAARPMADLPDVASVLAFFREGAREAADPG